MKQVNLFFFCLILLVFQVRAQESIYSIEGAVEVGGFGPKQYSISSQQIDFNIYRRGSPQFNFYVMRKVSDRWSYGIGVVKQSWQTQMYLSNISMPIDTESGNISWRHSPSTIYQSRIGLDFKVRTAWKKMTFSLTSGLYKVYHQNKIADPYSYNYTLAHFGPVPDYTSVLANENYYEHDRRWIQMMSSAEVGVELGRGFSLFGNIRYSWFSQSRSPVVYKLYFDANSSYDGSEMYHRKLNLTIREPSICFALGLRYRIDFKRKAKVTALD